MDVCSMRRLVAVCLFGLTACPPKAPPGPGEGERPRVEVKKDSRADDALKTAGDTATGQGKKKGIEAYLAVRKAYPDTTAGQDALYQAGVLAFEEGDWVTSRKALNELLFENPLYEKANDARLKSALAALELKAYRDAYQMLTPLIDKLDGADKQKAQDALQRAAAGAQQYGEALKLALKAVDDAKTDADKKTAMESLEETVESKTSFLALAEVWHELPSTHPAWPLITFKLAKVYYHLRDWVRLDETLRKLVADAPSSPWTPDAKALLERTARRKDVRPNVVGAVLPMTGKYKALGEAVMRGAQLALKGSGVELVVKDSQGDINLAGKMVEELTFEAGAIAIIGPLLADDSRRAALVAEELQVPIVTMTRGDGITDIGPHVFRNMVTSQQQAEALAEYATTELGFKTFGVLYPNIPFGVELANDFWTEIEKRGATMRAAEAYAPDQTTFTEQAQGLVGRKEAYLYDRHDYNEKLREIRDNKELDDFRKRKAVEKLKSNLPPIIDFEALLIPDAWQKVSLVAPALAVEDIVTNGCDRKDIERILKTTGKSSVRELKPVVLLGPSTWSSPKTREGDYELVTRGGKFVLCSIYVDSFYEGSSRKATKVFVDQFHDAHGGAQPTLLDAVGYDTAGIVRTVIEKNKPASRDDFTKALGMVKDYDGATGQTRFDDKREAQKPLFLLTIDPKGIKEIPLKAKPSSG
ncbi:MAG: ABC transporter substrate-binding protein [Myxococcaceae bacterium]|nr:ABC transporter substrate-binding protein [Myxococcaceae bacterium]